MSDWQPIDTAPKDGTLIIAWRDEWDGPISLMWQMDYRAGREMWCFGGYSFDDDQPTYWIPIPTYPQSGVS